MPASPKAKPSPAAPVAPTAPLGRSCWVVFIMGILVLAAGMLLGIGGYAIASSNNPELANGRTQPVISEPIAIATTPAPESSETPSDFETRIQAVLDLEKECSKEGDGSWLSKVKNLGSFLNKHKYKIGGAIALTGAACYGYSALSGPTPIAVDDGAGELCGTGGGRRKGLDPAKWGPPTWDFLHSVTCDYPDNPTKKEQEAAKQLVTSLKTLLPCGKCRKHFSKNVEVLSPKNDYHTTKENFGKFIADVRRSVAKSCGKDTIKGIKVDDFCFDKVQKLYGGAASTCGGPPKKPFGSFLKESNPSELLKGLDAAL